MEPKKKKRTVTVLRILILAAGLLTIAYSFGVLADGRHDPHGFAGAIGLVYLAGGISILGVQLIFSKRLWVRLLGACAALVLLLVVGFSYL